MVIGRSPWLAWTLSFTRVRAITCAWSPLRGALFAETQAGISGVLIRRMDSAYLLPLSVPTLLFLRKTRPDALPPNCILRHLIQRDISPHVLQLQEVVFGLASTVSYLIPTLLETCNGLYNAFERVVLQGVILRQNASR